MFGTWLSGGGRGFNCHFNPSMASSKQRGSFYELFFTNCQGIVFFWRHSTDMEFSSAHLQIPCRVCETANHNTPSPCAPHENTHWLFVLMLGPNITIVSGSLPHSSLDGHLGEFVYNVCFEWKFKIPRPQDVRLNCGLNSILHFFPPKRPCLHYNSEQWMEHRRKVCFCFCFKDQHLKEYEKHMLPLIIRESCFKMACSSQLLVQVN